MRIVLILILGLLVGDLVANCLAEETITITTYYPSPFGVYNEMRAKRIAIGDNYHEPSKNRWGYEINNDADLVVEGNVGIGTMDPGTNRLQVNGKIQAIGGDICTDQGGGRCLSASF